MAHARALVGASLTVSVPLQVAPTDLWTRSTLTASVTYASSQSAPVGLQQLIINTRPPGGGQRYWRLAIPLRVTK